MAKINKRGSVALQLFFLLLLMSSVTSMLMFTETKVINIKRQDIHNAIIASSLAIYEGIEQGDKNVLMTYEPYELQGYLLNPSTIPSTKRNEILNLMTSEYFPTGERYKGVYLEKSKALPIFKQYLGENLNLNYGVGNVLTPKDTESSSKIQRLEIKEFFIHNAISNWDSDKANVNNDIISNSKTSNHILVNVDIPNMVKIGSFSGTMTIPIHIDTSVTMFHS